MMEELKGLTTEEIEEKTKQGKTNKIKIKANESVLKIIRKNIFTYFNLIFLILAILLITSQSYRNLTFLIIITINILIGIFQQIKSKITLDKLSLLDKNDYIVRVPKILTAAAFVRINGVMAMVEFKFQLMQ